MTKAGGGNSNTSLYLPAVRRYRGSNRYGRLLERGSHLNLSLRHI